MFDYVRLAVAALSGAMAISNTSLIADEPVPQPASQLIADDQIEMEFAGTGETINEVMQLTVTNKTPEALTVNVPPMLLVSTNRETQDYAAPFGQTVSVPGGDAVTVPVIGVCLIRNKPALGAGVSGTTLALMADGTPVNPPAEDAPDSVKALTELESFSQDNVNRLLAIAETHYIAANELQEEDELEEIPYPDPQMKKDIVIEWGIWSDPEIATILQHEPATRNDLAEVINEQVSENFEGNVPEQVQEKVDVGIEAIFAGVQLTKERAKKLDQKRGPPIEAMTVGDGLVMNINDGLRGPPPDRPLGETPYGKKTKKSGPVTVTKKSDGTVILTKKKEGTTWTETRYPNGKVKIEQVSDGFKQTVVFDGDKIVTTQDRVNGKTRTLTTSLDSQTAVDQDGKKITLTKEDFKEIREAGWHPYFKQIKDSGTDDANLWLHPYGRIKDEYDEDKKQYVKRLVIDHIDNSRTTKTWYQDGTMRTTLTEYLDGVKTIRMTTVDQDANGNWVRSGQSTTYNDGSGNPPTTTTIYEKNKAGVVVSRTTHGPMTKYNDSKGETKKTTVYRPDGTPEETTYVNEDGTREVVVGYDGKGKPRKVTTTTKSPKDADEEIKRESKVTLDEDGTITTVDTITKGSGPNATKDEPPAIRSKPNKEGGRTVETIDEDGKPYDRSEYDKKGKWLKSSEISRGKWSSSVDDFFKDKGHLINGPKFPAPSPKLPTTGSSIHPPIQVNPAR